MKKLCDLYYIFLKKMLNMAYCNWSHCEKCYPILFYCNILGTILQHSTFVIIHLFTTGYSDFGHQLLSKCHVFYTRLKLKWFAGLYYNKPGLSLALLCLVFFSITTLAMGGWLNCDLLFIIS